jgi:hypothetical protein
VSNSDKDSDVVAIKETLEFWRHAKQRVQWLPLLSAVLIIVLHWIIETKYVAYPVSGPVEHAPLLLELVFRGTVLATFVLVLFCFPRWQTFTAFFALGFLICSLSGR